MRWLGKGILKGKKNKNDKDFVIVERGEKIPAGLIGESRLKQLKERGLVGDETTEEKKVKIEKKIEEKKKSSKADKE
jgi:hypothetical protein